MSEIKADDAEWLEIVEPTTKRHFFANLKTGEWRWTVPPGGRLKKCSDERSQWWEMFDNETNRFYYYNVSSQTKVWHKPSKGDIIPLKKNQTSIMMQNSQCSEERETREKSLPPADPMRRENRRATSARSHRDTSASQRSRRNQSQRMMKGEHHIDSDRSGHSSSAVTDLLRSCEQNNPKSRLSRAEKREEIHNWWRSQSFGKSDECDLRSSPSHDKYRSDVVPDSKQLSTNRFCSVAQNDERNSSTTGSHDELKTLHYSSNELCSFDNEPKRRMRAGNWSVDSGIAADVSCAPYEATCISLPNSSSDVCHFRCDAAQFSGSAQRSGGSELSQTALETLQLPFAFAAVNVTPRSQHQAFPRANLNFVTSQKVSVQTTGPLISQVSNDSTDFGTSSNSVPDREIHQQRSSRQNVDGTVFSQTRHKMDRSDSSGRKVIREDSISKSICSARRSADSSTCETSFSFLRFPRKTSDLSLSAGKTCMSVNPNASCEYKSGHGGAHSSDFKQNSSAFLHHVSERPVVKQNFGAQFVIEEDKLEECHRIRRKSEPDYYNLCEIETGEETAVQECVQLKTNSAGREFDRARSVRAKAEPVYANELLTGRGCLTHEERYHLPSRTSNHDSSLSSTASSTISTPSPKLQTKASHLSRMTRHISLRRKKMAEKSSETSKSFIDKSRSLLSELVNQSPVSVAAPVDPEMDSIEFQVADTLMQRADMEQFLSENLNAPRKGLLGKAVPINNMLVWTKDAIQKPMIRTDNKVVRKEAPEVFKLIQTYMGDRKSRESGSCLALEVANKGWTIQELRDEIYVQLCRQTTKNSRDESLLNGWELLGICLSFFPPSRKFHSYLEGHIYQMQESHDHTEGSKLHAYALSCMRRLDKIFQTGATRKPNIDDLERCRKSLLHPSMFGGTLEDVMDLQKEKYPTYHLPWIQVTLSEALLNIRGRRMPEGIFRVPGDADEINILQDTLDNWKVPDPRTDPHVLASVLKLWYRELCVPLIPDEFYADCVANFDNPRNAIKIVNSLPLMHKLVLTYLIKFLQILASPEYSVVTKMDASNLAMVMAPNCLRCHAPNTQTVYENVRKEMAFIRTLIQNLDASGVE